MKKPMLITILIFSLILGVVFIPQFIREFRSSIWLKKYSHLHLIADTAHYKIMRVTDQQVEENSDMVLFSEKERKAIIDSGEYPGSIYSHVFYNPSEGVFGIKLITDNREWVKFNAKGEILGTLASEENPHHTSWKMVEKELESNYFTKKPSALYIRYFAKQTYNWSRLNPFAGIGSTTGGVELNWLWIGEAFMELKLAKENIIFKTGCKLSESHGYQTVVSSYRVPKEYTQGKEVVFLYQNKYNGNEENAGWYIIIEK